MFICFRFVGRLRSTTENSFKNISFTDQCLFLVDLLPACHENDNKKYVKLPRVARSICSATASDVGTLKT